MAKPRKVTEIVMSVRVAQNSPLERLLVQKAEQGVSRTVAVHQMAELLERAINEDWGPRYKPQPGPESLVQAYQIGDDRLVTEDGRQYVRDENGVYQEECEPEIGESAKRIMQGLEEVVQIAEGKLAPARVFAVSEDGLTTREVGEQEALALASQQYPAGLVPVGIDDGDDLPDSSLSVEADDEATDLSHLV